MQHINSLLLILISCNIQNTKAQLINPEGKTLHTRIKTPENYFRTNTPLGDFYGNLPIKKDKSPVLLYDGSLKNNQNAHCAIINWQIGNKDLLQCADAAMRLYAEYHYANKDYSKIHFNFTNGFNCQYSRWAEGFRPNSKYNGWVKKYNIDYSYNTFQQYLEMVYTFAGSASLSKELVGVPLQNIKVGDLLIRGGFPGHVCTILDVAQNEKGEKIFLLAQSYMPAQNIQILKNNNSEISPWYSLKEIKDAIYTPEYTFSVNEIKRFKF